LAGLCIGLLVFTKLVYVPVALVGVGCFLLARREFFKTAAIALGAFISSLVVVSLLLLRAEFWPFIGTIKLNIAYSQGTLIGFKKGSASLVEHIRRIGSWRLAGELAPISLAIVLVVLFGIRDRSRAQLGIAGVCFSTLASSLLVLLCTGLWPYHKQILNIPSIFAVVAVAPLIDMAAKRARLSTLGLVSLTGYLMAGSPDLRQYVQSVHTSFAELSWVSPESQRLLALGNSGTYARLGWGDNGHAIGLGHWKLACPRFHQYPFDPEAVLNTVLECASTSPTLLISHNFLPRQEPSSKEFIARVEHLLNKSYSCDADSGLRVCTRRGE
jgi:hypothetical protein